MTPQELMYSTLYLALQGRLVDQLPQEGTGNDVCLQNKADHAVYCKNHKIKPSKPSQPISEDEILFDIPANWTWTRISDYCIDVFSGKSPVYSKLETPYKVIGQAANQQKGLDLSQAKYTTKEFWESMPTRYFLNENDVLLNTLGNGTLGRSGMVPALSEALLTDGHLFVFRFCNVIQAKYFYYFLQYRKKEIEKSANGSTNQTFLSLSKTLTWLVPVPPLAEQKRIVAKIEELLPYIDRYEQAWSRLEDFNRRFPVDMQKSILQMAIQGKLVEQRSEEGTGEELYQQIQQEKQRLIKAGTIKKEKPLPEITEDEIPFDIPEGWKWVRFSELMISMSTGPFGSMLHKSDYVAKGIPLVNPANIVRRTIVPSDKMMISTETAKRLESYTLRAGMIVMGRRGEMGRCAVVTDVEDGWLCGTGSFFMQPSSKLYVQYISTFFTTPYAKAYLGGESVGTTMSNLNHKILNSIPVPLPPLAEQKRIVAKLEEILPLCERLK